MTPNFNWEFSKFGYSLKLLKASIPHLPSIHSPHQPRFLANPPSIPHTNHDPSPTLHPFPTPTTIPHQLSIHSPHQPRSLTYHPSIPHANHDPSPTLHPFPTPTTIPHLPSSHSPHQPRSLTNPPSIPHTNHDPSPTLHPFPTPTTIPHLPSIHSPRRPRFHTHSSLPLIQPLHSISSLHSQYLHYVASANEIKGVCFSIRGAEKELEFATNLRRLG